ncbi:MAG: nitroreductase family protein [Bacteroidales bacterium]|nr:nitroreductase family protein [Bacteroidales bacterium]
MGNFLELAMRRYSVRNYSDVRVEEEKLNYILECGRVAPSAANNQPWHIIVIRDVEMRRKLAMTYNRDWFIQAPVILVICGDHQSGWKRADGKDHTDIDVSIIIDHITLAAAEQGLGTCWICNFDAILCSQVLALPQHIEPIAYLPVGYPADSTDNNSRHLKRKSLNEIIHYETF